MWVAFNRIKKQDICKYSKRKEYKRKLIDTIKHLKWHTSSPLLSSPNTHHPRQRIFLFIISKNATIVKDCSQPPANSKESSSDNQLIDDSIDWVIEKRLDSVFLQTHHCQENYWRIEEQGKGMPQKDVDNNDVFPLNTSWVLQTIDM